MSRTPPLPSLIGACVDRKSRVLVSATNSRVHLFTPGQFHLPHAMAMDSKGFIYVVEASNQRIQKFAP